MSMFNAVGSIQMLDATRAMFNSSVAVEDLRKLAGHPRVRVLQCGDPVGREVWQMLDEEFFSLRPDVELRVLHHIDAGCDLSFAGGLKHVRRFSADCLLRATNLEAIAEMSQLEELTIGVFELKTFGFLERVTDQLTSLAICDTRTKSISLAPLRRFQNLRKLYLEGHHREIEVLATLKQLEDVTLRSITTPDLRYLTDLTKLWSLDIKLGGIRSFAGIEGKESIKYLELWQIRELRNIDVIETLPGLQYLFLQSLPHISSIPSLERLKSLRRMVVANLKGLHDFASLESAPAVEEFALLEGDKQAPEELLPVLQNPVVQRAIGYFGSQRKNEAFTALRKAYGKAEWDPYAPFDYV
jgi:hypothetical protein